MCLVPSLSHVSIPVCGSGLTSERLKRMKKTHHETTLGYLNPDGYITSTAMTMTAASVRVESTYCNT